MQLDEHMRHHRSAEAVLAALRAIVDGGAGVDALFPFVSGEAPPLLGCERAALFLVREASDGSAAELWSRIDGGAPAADARGAGDDGAAAPARIVRVPVDDQSIAGATALLMEPQLVADAYKDHRFDPSWDQRLGLTTRSVLCVPLLAHGQLGPTGGRCLGCLQLINKLPRAHGKRRRKVAERATFRGKDLATANEFASVLGRAIEACDRRSRGFALGRAATWAPRRVAGAVETADRRSYAFRRD